jgi:hypothetical protein
MHARRWFIPLVILAAGCEREAAWNGSLESLLESRPDRFGKVMEDPAAHRVQIIYTQINRDADNAPSFQSFTYRVDDDEYFYPASTVKLPTALLALEKLNELAIPGLTRDSVMLTGAVGDVQTAQITDETSPGGLPTVAHYIRKILLVSDNDAFNRLYEFLGQQALNERMHEKGYRGTRIMHRLEIALGLDDNRHTNPVVFTSGDAVVFEQNDVMSDRWFTADEPILLGQAEIVDGQRLERPKDFAEKNAFPLQEQHDMLLALMFPDSVPARWRFGLTEDDYRFVYRNMSGYPGDSGIDAYADSDRYPDGYVKFLMFGGDADAIPDNIRIFNKVGDAYGFLTDVAYIVDVDNGVEFILAATIYTNANATFNDNEYEYDTIGLPFLEALGQTVYEFELERDRPHPPDLGRFLGSE